MNSSNISNKQNNVSYINAELSKRIDDELMGLEIGYSIDQLMEIAGLSVSLAIENESKQLNLKKILNISGPGSNNK